MGHEKEECECCEGKEQTMTEIAVEIGDKAWMAVLQRKFEAMLEKEKGKEMGKVAAVAYEYVTKYYAASMQGKSLPKGETEEFEKKLNAAMMP